MLDIVDEKVNKAGYLFLVFEKIREGNYFGEDGAVDFSIRGLENPKLDRSMCLSVISGVQCALAMRHKVDRQLSSWYSFEKFAAHINYKNRLSDAEDYSDKWMKEVFGKTVSAEELLIRSEILFERGKYNEAKILISQALSTHGTSVNTLTLLRVFLAKIYHQNKDEYGERSAPYHFKLAMDVAAHLEPHVAVRVRQAFSEYCLSINDIRNALIQADMALEVIVHHDLIDLSTKLQPLLCKLKKYRNK